MREKIKIKERSYFNYKFAHNSVHHSLAIERICREKSTCLVIKLKTKSEEILKSSFCIILMKSK